MSNAEYVPQFRVDGHWGVEIIRSGDGKPDPEGRRPDDRLFGVMFDPDDAAKVVWALNEIDKLLRQQHAAKRAAENLQVAHRLPAEPSISTHSPERLDTSVTDCLPSDEGRQRKRPEQ